MSTKKHYELTVTEKNIYGQKIVTYGIKGNFHR